MDKDETSSALKPGANPNGSWADSDLSVSGTYLRNRIRLVNDGIFKALEAAGK